MNPVPPFVTAGLASPRIASLLQRLKPGGQPEPQLEGRVPDSLLATLKPYQVEGILFAIRRGGRAFLGDEMGGSL